MHPVSEALLGGELLEALEGARALLALREDTEARVGLVRALVGLVRPTDATEAARTLPVGEGAVGHALVELANGRPGRARSLLMEHGQADDLLTGLVLAELHRAAGDPARAVEAAARVHGRTPSLDVRWAGHTGLALGRALADAGDEERGQVVVDEALAVFEAHCAETVLVAETLDAAGSLARRLRDPARAVLLHRRALGIWTAVLGEEAGPVGGCRYSLAQALHRTGELPEALASMQQAWLVTGRTLGADHLDTWITRFELGRMEVDVGQVEEGFAHMEAARAEVRGRLGAQHPVVRSMDRWL